jgi:voltage-gated potassium channel
MRRRAPPRRRFDPVAELGHPFEGQDPAEPRVVFPRRRLSAQDSLAIRVFIALACIVITTLVVYWDRDGYRDGGQQDELDFLDALYYATVTLSTTGYGDITPVSDTARLINILVITPLRFVFLIVLVGTTIEVLTAAARQRSRVNRWRKHMKDRTVVVGFGVKGQAALRSLLAHGVEPDEVVVIADDRYGVADATRRGVVGVVGDARNEQVLRDAGVPSATRVIIAADQDDTAIMVTLRVRAMAPTATIVAAAREASAADLLRQSGADRVIVHAESAGNLMGLSMLSGNVGEMVEDLMDTGRGLEVVERPISRAELGLAPSDVQAEGELVLAVVRDGVVHRFDAQSVRVFQTGDRIVVIRGSHDGSAPGASGPEAPGRAGRSTLPGGAPARAPAPGRSAEPGRLPQ